LPRAHVPEPCPVIDVTVASLSFGAVVDQLRLILAAVVPVAVPHQISVRSPSVVSL